MILDIFFKKIKKRYYNTETIILLLLTVIGFFFILFLTNSLFFILLTLIISYLLNVIICFLEKKFYIPHFLSLLIVYTIFLSMVFITIFMFIPLVYNQIIQFINEIPKILSFLYNFLDSLPKKYPKYISKNNINLLSNSIIFSQQKITDIGKALFSVSISSIPEMFSFLKYFILIPFLVFFILKDKNKLLSWICKNIPFSKEIIANISSEMKHQMGNYLKGKSSEMIIIGFFSYIAFLFFNLNFSILLSCLISISVLIPYIGMIIVTIPLIVVSMFQFGITKKFYYILVVYFIIQAFDGNILAPILYSEVMNLHPLIIVFSVLFFGEIWGIWGLFFSIPLTIFIKSIISFYMKQKKSCIVNTNGKKIKIIN